MLSNQSQCLQAARDAVDYVRRQLTFRAANKWIPADPKRAGFNRLRLMALRSLTAYENFHAGCYTYSLTIEQFRAYASDITATRTGNCSEHAILAFNYLYEQGQRNMELVALFNADHMFVVLGSSRPTGPCPPGSFLPMGSVICDPWANIVCWGYEFPRAWEAKMNKWERKGKEIVTNEQGDRIKPTQSLLAGSYNVFFSV